MDRLTKRIFATQRYILDNPSKCRICSECINQDNCSECSFDKTIQNLGHYEDTGLTPAEVAELAQANEQLKELLQLAVVDMHHCDCCEVCKNHDNQPNCGSGCEICELDCECNLCMDEDLFTWQHSDKLKGLIEI